MQLVHDQDVPFRIAYEDDALLVVDKPAGVVVHPAPGRTDGTLVHGLLAEGIAGGDDADRPGHRAPARPRHVGPAGGRPKSEQVHAALGRSMRGPRDHARVRRARARPARRRAPAASRRPSAATAARGGWPSTARRRGRP